MEIRNRQSFTYSKSNSNEGINDESNNESDDSSRSIYKKLRVYICTWNVNTKSPNFNINDLFAFDADNPPDVCAFGFQEVSSTPLQRFYDFFYNDPWTNELDRILSEKQYIRIQSTRLVGIMLNIYVKRNILVHVKCCSDDWIRLGFWGFWGNKGANICAFKIGGINICFVNSHLSAHQHNDKIRLLEHAKILYHSFRLEKALEAVSDQNYLFFFGDLNFRIENLESDLVKELIDKKDYKTLQENDQLRKCICKEKCFSIFKEDEIHFPPTYKFKINSDEYDLTKKDRVPSYCDRVLYKITKTDFLSCKSLNYNCIPSFKQSDHRPVYALFEVNALNWESDEPNVKFLEIFANNDQNLEISYQVSYAATTSQNDWIGIYDPSFRSFDDYVTYVWAAKIYELDDTKKDTKETLLGNSDLSKNFIRRKIVLEQKFIKNGYYMMGYFSSFSNCLIGLSSIFQIQLS
ncbi:unnamed protein product [Brachionus calyciflorus]|uniref:Inositol polyphosphate-related phosphatase domain-containing protein n=1 Tax=Brachionus calyciflorus TaxID=104777 RepID=A0A813MN11_9BILA|nr:unnamed protein product [Brachionus calyciflorus]